MASRQAQALAIKLSQERRAGKRVPAPPKGRYSERTRKKALRDLEIGRKRTRSKTKRVRRTKQGRRATKL